MPVRKVMIQWIGIPFNEIPHGSVCNDGERCPRSSIIQYIEWSHFNKKAYYVILSSAAYILNIFCVSILMFALREVWKDNSKMLIVLFEIKEKVGARRVGSLLGLQFQTVYISVLFELFYNQSIQLYNQKIRLKYFYSESKKYTFLSSFNPGCCYFSFLAPP